MRSRFPRTVTLTTIFLFTSLVVASAETLGELADRCMMAVTANDEMAFQDAAEALKQRQDVFDTAARVKAEQCLSSGYGEPWEYWFPSDSFEPSAAIAARIKATADAKAADRQAKADAEAAAAQKEADRKSNAERVAALVYGSCATLLARDEVEAMTNQICVESFLANGLPSH